MKKAEKIAIASDLRDLAIELVARESDWQRVHSDKQELAVRGVDKSRLSILYTTPFQALPGPAPTPSGASARDKYSRALLIASDLKRESYLLDIWYDGSKTFSVAWNTDCPLVIVCFQRGTWEFELRSFNAEEHMVRFNFARDWIPYRLVRGSD